MSGNVWEWCLTDYFKPQERAADENLRSGASRVLRGGSWDFIHYDARAAYRYGGDPYDRYDDVGFRLVCVRAPSL